MSLLLDTCIFIDFLRGKPKALQFIIAMNDTPAISAITVAELFAGVREGEERFALEKMLGVSTLVPVTSEIAVQAGLFVREFRASHNVGLADALIAASAKISKRKLVTLNVRHFPMLENLSRPY